MNEIELFYDILKNENNFVDMYDCVHYEHEDDSFNNEIVICKSLIFDEDESSYFTKLYVTNDESIGIPEEIEKRSSTKNLTISERFYYNENMTDIFQKVYNLFSENGIDIDENVYYKTFEVFYTPGNQHNEMHRYNTFKIKKDDVDEHFVLDNNKKLITCDHITAKAFEQLYIVMYKKKIFDESNMKLDGTNTEVL